MAETQVEPWLRGTHTDVEPIRRAVLHALQLAREDVVRWCAPLDSDAVEAEPLGLPSAAFQMRHIARSLDRLMTYAEGRSLTEEQLLALRQERVAGGEPLLQFTGAVDRATERLLAFSPEQFADSRRVGQAMLPTTVAGLLIHIAEHTQRHVGQAITTSKVVVALQENQGS
jgi:uncharacterized damage-inducible protein DinB